MPTYNPNLPPRKDIENSSRFTEALSRLSQVPEQLAAITPQDIDIAQIRQTLEVSGCNLEPGAEALDALKDSQFRNFDSGRGAGVFEIIGPQKAALLQTVVPDLAKDRAQIGKRQKTESGQEEFAGRQGSEGRGLYQFVADTLQLVTTPNPDDQIIAAYCRRLNQRVYKGYLKAKEYRDNPEAQVAIRDAFAGVEDKSDTKTFASIPPHTLSRLWKLLVG